MAGAAGLHGACGMNLGKERGWAGSQPVCGIGLCCQGLQGRFGRGGKHDMRGYCNSIITKHICLFSVLQAALTRRCGRITRRGRVSTAATVFLMAWSRTNAWK